MTTKDFNYDLGSISARLVWCMPIPSEDDKSTNDRFDVTYTFPEKDSAEHVIFGLAVASDGKMVIDFTTADSVYTLHYDNVPSVVAALACRSINLPASTSTDWDGDDPEDFQRQVAALIDFYLERADRPAGVTLQVTGRVRVKGTYYDIVEGRGAAPTTEDLSPEGEVEE